MTDWDDNDNASPAMKQMRKLIKEQGKKLAEFETMKMQFDNANRSVNVADALASRNLDPRIAKFYPSDLGTDDASIDAWVTENKTYFGDRRVINDDGSADQDTLTESERRGYQALQDMQAYEAAQMLDFKSRLDAVKYDPDDPDKSTNEILRVVSEFGATHGM